VYYVRTLFLAFLSAFLPMAPCAFLPGGHDQLREAEPDKRTHDRSAVVAFKPSNGDDVPVAKPAPGGTGFLVRDDSVRPPFAATAGLLAPAQRARDQRDDVVAGLRGLPPPVMHAAA